jgi:hypothetical protein
MKDTQSGGAVQGVFLGGEDISKNGREEVLICAMA